MGNQLKPCPFCGRIPEMVNPVGRSGYVSVTCPSDGGCEVAPDVQRPTEPDAIAAWNRRHP